MRRPSRGFTLIELLVALFITAIIFVMGYGAIEQALADQKALKAEQQRLTTVQHAVQVLVQDFSQLTPRPVRDEIGNGSLPCLIGSPQGVSITGSASSSTSLDSSSTSLGSSSPGSATVAPPAASGNQANDSAQSASAGSASAGLDLVAFTRMGWANPAGVQRPTEERVSYRLENGVLERLHWPELDVTEGTMPITQNLLDHVKSITFRYLTDAHQWTDQWPPQTNAALPPLAGNPMLRLRPIAVEVTLDLKDWGTIVRIIEIPT